MADNVELNQGVGGPVTATDEINGAHHQFIKMEFGAKGQATPVSEVNPLPITGKYFSNQVGAWGYHAGVSGTLVLSGGKKVVGISAFSSGGGTMAINGGDSYPVVPSTGIFISPQGNMLDPVIIFTGTNSFFVEYVS